MSEKLKKIKCKHCGKELDISTETDKKVLALCSKCAFDHKKLQNYDGDEFSDFEDEDIEFEELMDDLECEDIDLNLDEYDGVFELDYEKIDNLYKTSNIYCDFCGNLLLVNKDNVNKMINVKPCEFCIQRAVMNGIKRECVACQNDSDELDELLTKLFTTCGSYYQKGGDK